MSASPGNDARMEVKFVTSETAYSVLDHWIRQHAACFRTPYPDRWVNNIYFDTPDATAYRENLFGISARNKVRYRWYGLSQLPQAGQLEVKRKRNSVGWKLQFPVEGSPYREGSTWAEIRRRIQIQLSAEGAMWLCENPCPILINRYLRRYFVSRDGRIRVTLDMEQTVWEQRRKAHPNVLHRANLPGILVVEYKFAREDYAQASRYIQGIPVRRYRYSKYVAGVQSIVGGI